MKTDHFFWLNAKTPTQPLARERVQFASRTQNAKSVTVPNQKGNLTDFFGLVNKQKTLGAVTSDEAKLLEILADEGMTDTDDKKQNISWLTLPSKVGVSTPDTINQLLKSLKQKGLIIRKTWLDRARYFFNPSYQPPDPQTEFAKAINALSDKVLPPYKKKVLKVLDTLGVRFNDPEGKRVKYKDVYKKLQKLDPDFTSSDPEGLICNVFAKLKNQELILLSFPNPASVF